MTRARLLLAALLALAPPAPAQEIPEGQPPFITTPDEVVLRMLKLAGTGPQDLVVDLGSGDGRIVISAAREFGARGLGLEINPGLVARSREYAARAGVAARTEFRAEDVLAADLSAASVVTMYLLPGLIDKLQPRFLAQLKPGTRIVSHSFPMIGWRPDRVETVRLSRSHPGQGDESRIFLWVVPAEARGTWRGGGWRLRIEQNFQDLEIDAEHAGARVAVERGALAGRELAWRGPGLRFRGRIEGGRIVGELLRDGRAEPLTLTRAPG